MTDTFLGIVIGVLSSLIAGVLLLWRGEEFVKHLRHRPAKRRVLLYSLAYRRALRSYPYRYLHLAALTTIQLVLAATTVSYLLLTYNSFAGRDASGKAIVDLLPQAWLSQFSNVIPWLLTAITILLACWLVPSIFRSLSVELLIPYTHRDVQRLRSCVSRLATPQQLIEYTDVEHAVRTTADLAALFKRAKEIIGDHQFLLIDGMLANIADETTRQPTQTQAPKNFKPRGKRGAGS